MKTYIISYELKHTRNDYSKLYSTIKGFGDWFHALESTWFVRTDKSTKEMLNDIYPNLIQESPLCDMVFICELNIDNRSGWMSKTVWEWINKNNTDNA